MEELGERIRLLRGKLQLPRAEFAVLIGVSPTALFNYECGDREPNADILIRICKETHANPQWLLLGLGPIYEDDVKDIYTQLIKNIVNRVSSAILSEEQQKLLISKTTEYIYSKLFNKCQDQHIDMSSLASIFDNLDKDNSKNKVFQKAQGNNIIQAGRDVGPVTIKTTNKKQEIKIQPPEGSIGSDSFLLQRIQGKFNELGLRREERFGKTSYPVMYSEFKKYFNIPRNQKYTSYQLWPKNRGKEILYYLEEKLDNTIKGRKLKANVKKGQTTQNLLSESTRLHKLLGWTEQQYRAHLHYLFGVTSRSELDIAQLTNYVAYLKEKIDE